MSLMSPLFQNATLIISFMFLALKFKDHLVGKGSGRAFVRILVPLSLGVLATLVMYLPFDLHGMRFDLRNVPVFFAAYIGGWKCGLGSAVLPAAYRIYLGGETAWVGVVSPIGLGVLLGSIFHSRMGTGRSLVIIDLKRMMGAYMIFSVVHVFLNLLAMGFKYEIILANANTTLFSALAVLGVGVMVNDSTEDLLEYRRLTYQSHYDQKTGLPNLSYFREEAEKIVRQGGYVALAMMDIDFFKVYNDTHGHPEGDKVLSTIGMILRRNLREDKDVFGRFGGEEFVLLFHGVQNEKQAGFIAERIRTSVESYPFNGREQQPDGRLTVSIGVACSSGGKSLDNLIGQADAALYRSKQSGRNRVTLVCNDHDQEKT